MDGRTRKDHACVADSSGDHLACFAHGADYIGPDPVRWVERLMDVNMHAQWSTHTKKTINKALSDLYGGLHADATPS